MQKLTRHHRKPKSQGGTGTRENISRIPDKKHRAWHILFRDMPPERIAAEINNIYLDPDFQFIAAPKNN